MNRHDAMRRRLLRAGMRLATGAAALPFTGLAQAQARPAPRVAFLDTAAAAAALADGADDPYYGRMGLLEIRARLQSALPGMSLADARLAARDHDAAAARPFEAEERDAITAVIDSMQPLLAARAPLYARTPWSFVQLDDRAEGGMPHTRGPHVVLPRSVVDVFVKLQRQVRAGGRQAAPPRGAGLLLHEQTHVLERLHPARFEPLFTQVFGFTRMAGRGGPTTPWLAAHRCTNPDGPDVAWAFPLATLGGTGWVMPDVVLPDKPLPRMPQDFQAVGIEVSPGIDWRVVERDGEPVRHDLDRIAGWHAHFPFPDEDFHPHEIAAVTLAHWILRDVPDIDGRPLMPAVAAWARTGLA
ncbi:MAG: hypothetical protein JF586_14915 [Burkholderiales bacterium]|nr:hypothetical protein [Burkholderiales bacterium]